MNSPSPEELLLGQVDRVLASRVVDKSPHRDFKARVQQSAVPYVVKAAADRGLSVSAFIRRAAIAVAAYDQGLDLDEVLADEPATRLKYEGVKADRQDAGKGHGEWHIGSLS